MTMMMITTVKFSQRRELTQQLPCSVMESRSIQWTTTITFSGRWMFVRYPAHESNIHAGWTTKTGIFVLYALTSSNIDRFSNLFHSLHQENICSNAITIDPTTPRVCLYTTLWNVSVLKARIENKSTLRVRRPAARRTHWIFDVKPAGCDSYFR